MQKPCSRVESWNYYTKRWHANSEVIDVMRIRSVLEQILRGIEIDVLLDMAAHGARGLLGFILSHSRDVRGR